MDNTKLLLLLPEVKGRYRVGADLSKNTWFNVGGKADILFKPEDVQDLSCFLKNKPKGLPVYILGACSNVIIRDKSVDGVVIKLGSGFAKVNIDDDKVEIGCATLDYNAAVFLLEQGLSGLEFLVGIPGVMGGAIAMNSGCYGREIADHLLFVEAVHIKTGNVCKLMKEELGLSYRSNKLAKDFIFTKTTFQLKKKNKKVIKSDMDYISKIREESQPVRFKTGGSTFKNPKDSKYKAWQLVEKSGLRGYRIGNAQISDKHCNFIINLGSATAKDLEELGEFVRSKVYKDNGVMLEWEIKRIGR